MGAHVSVPMYRRTIPQRLGLEAARCGDCGTVAFPPRPRCAVCSCATQHAVRLSGRGRLHAWTRIGAAGAPPEFSGFAHVGGSYYVGIVDLEEGPRITAMLVDFDREPSIDAAVRAVVRRLYEEEGVIRYGFKFAPELDRGRHLGGEVDH